MNSDEFENSRISPDTGETLMNYWGYSTVGFFAPKSGLLATGKWVCRLMNLRPWYKNSIAIN